MRAAVGNYRKPTENRTPCKTNTRPNRPRKSCPLCKQASGPDNAHFLSECSFLPEQDRKYIAKARQIADIFDDPSEPETRPCVDESITDTDDTGSSPTSHVFRIQTRLSPYLDMFYAHHLVRVTIDSGVTGNMIRHTVVQCLGCQVTPVPNPSTKQMAHPPCTLSVRHASLLSVKDIPIPSKVLSLKILT